MTAMTIRNAGHLHFAANALTATLPIKTVTEGNAKEHWRPKAARAKAQRNATALLLRAPLRGFQLGDGVTVTLTRIAPGNGLDAHDNLPGSLKHVVDQIAAMLGVDDRDKRVTWRYAQRRGKPREYGVEVVVEPRAG